jgi:acyl-coenzyme A synthetase/AMP-(fatty) acid ligase
MAEKTVGLVARNDPLVAAGIMELLISRRPIWILNPLSADAQLADEMLRAPTGSFVALARDWARPSMTEVRPGLGMTIELDTRDVRLGAARPPESSSPPGPGTAAVLQTSGTTGPPKRVELAAAPQWASLGGVSPDIRGDSQQELRLRRGTVPLTLPLAHVGGLFGLLFPWVNGRRVALLDKFAPHAWAKIIKDHEVLTSGLVPAAMRMVLDAQIPPADLASLRSVRAGTAPVDPELVEEFENRYRVPVITAYGATEFGGGVASMTLQDLRRFDGSKRGSVGRPHAGVQLRIVGQDGEGQLPPGEVGRLYVKQGTGDWVMTNDLARLDEDGFLFIEGRVDDVINRGGFKVSLREIEQELRALPDVADAAAIGLADRMLGQVPAAAVVLRDGARTSGEELCEALKATMTRYKVPTAVVIVDQIPRNVSMKVDSQALAKLLRDPEPSRRAP